MELDTIQFNDFVKNITILWNKRYSSVDQTMISSGLVKVTNIPADSGNTREFSSIDSEEYAAFKGEGEQAARMKIQQGYNKIMYAYRFGLNVGISYELRTQNKYPEVINAITNNAKAAANRMDLDLTHRLTFGTASSYVDKDGRTVSITCGDGLPLFYSAHTLAGSSTTFRNRLANNPVVSKGAIEAMERLISEESYNHLGEKIVIPFDIIFSSDDANTVNTIREYLRSTASPDAIHSGVVNVYAGKYRHVILPRLATTATGAPDSTKNKYWGIASSQWSTFNLGIWEAPHLLPVNANNEDIQTDDWEFRSRVGYGICIVDAGWIKFSDGTGAA